MMIRTWLTMAFAAALLAGSACKNTDSSRPAGAPEGRRGNALPRTPKDATPLGASGTSKLGTSTGAGSPTGETTSGTSTGENAAKAPATGTTPGGTGNGGVNGTSTDNGSGSTNGTGPGK